MKRRSVIIIGSGVAGLYCALRCAEEAQVTLITKHKIIESSSSYAQGGIAAVFDPQDTFVHHIRDTMRAGAHHNSKRAVHLLVQEAPRHIAALLQLGVAFTMNQRGRFDLGREGGHSKRRIVHAQDMTGRAVEQALITAVRHHPNIVIKEWEFALELHALKRQVHGITTIHLKTKRSAYYQADAVVLATGGCGQVYPYTSNPAVVTGDGIAMALRAGAQVRDLEFVQFHPTAYYIPGQKPFLLSEALRGEGARLRNHLGKRFVNELLPRDQVSRAVYRQQRHGLVYLDFRHRSRQFLQQRFPGIYKRLLKDELRLERHLIPITPVAHYLCGGIHTDSKGRTSLQRLYAIGETAHTGVHGANRLASNSLLECLVFGARAADDILQLVPISKRLAPFKIPKIKLELKNSDTYLGLKQQLQNIMWEAGGIVRTRAGLSSGLVAMQALKQTLAQEMEQQTTPLSLELMNMAEIGEGILAAALRRRQSLGCHYRVN